MVGHIHPTSPGKEKQCKGSHNITPTTYFTTLRRPPKILPVMTFLLTNLGWGLWAIPESLADHWSIRERESTCVIHRTCNCRNHLYHSHKGAPGHEPSSLPPSAFGTDNSKLIFNCEGGRDLTMIPRPIPIKQGFMSQQAWREDRLRELDYYYRGKGCVLKAHRKWEIGSIAVFSTKNGASSLPTIPPRTTWGDTSSYVVTSRRICRA